jgi:molybdopterin-guanine dinucleotide biosynthesis protein A
MRSAVILAGGKSTRMKKDKGLTLLNGRPLVQHVMDRVMPVVDEVIIVVGNRDQISLYMSVVEEGIRVEDDIYQSASPLVGALTGLRKANGEYTLLVGCDMPFIKVEAVEKLFKAADGGSGATYQWSNGWIEPLLAVYHTEESQRLMEKQYFQGDFRLRRILYILDDVNMIPMSELRKIDVELVSFYNANTVEQLEKAEKMIRNAGV